jgi:hypothetical protein
VDVYLNNFVNAIWSLKGPKGPPLFVLVTFFLSKNFNHITKAASIVHLKSGGSYNRPSYFSTFTSHLHDDLLQASGFGYGRIKVTYYKRSIFDMVLTSSLS